MSHDPEQRIRAEYLEMPGLRLTLRQAERLCGVDAPTCKEAINALVDQSFLSVRPDGTYARVTDLTTRHRKTYA